MGRLRRRINGVALEGEGRRFLFGGGRLGLLLGALGVLALTIVVAANNAAIG